MIRSAYKDLVASLTSALMRPGISVGSTSGYPRVEIHSVTENMRLDKAGKLRMLTASIESITNDSMVKAHMMNEANLELLQDLKIGKDFRLIGEPIADQMQAISETADAQNTLYRVIQTVNFYVENNE